MFKNSHFTNVSHSIVINNLQKLYHFEKSRIYRHWFWQDGHCTWLEEFHVRFLIKKLILPENDLKLSDKSRKIAPHPLLSTSQRWLTIQPIRICLYVFCRPIIALHLYQLMLQTTLCTIFAENMIKYTFKWQKYTLLLNCPPKNTPRFSLVSAKNM